MVKDLTLVKMVMSHDQESETVRQRLRDVDEARGMIQKVGSRCIVLNTCIRTRFIKNRFSTITLAFFGRFL